MENLVGGAGDFTKLLTGLDLGLLLAVAVFALLLERARAVSDRWAVLIPLVLGGLLGALTSSAQAYTDGATITTHVVKGVLLNGAGASVIARLAAPMLTQLFGAPRMGA